MYNTELLTDLRIHKRDIDYQYPGIPIVIRNAMLDRLVRDLHNDTEASNKLVNTHGKCYTNFESVLLLAQAIDMQLRN